MYAGSYYTDEEKLMPPANYDGTALLQEESYSTDSEAVSGGVNFATGNNSSRASLFNLPFLSGIFGSEGGLRLSKIGTEEILILAAAAFLFFSKGGDKECAIILLILLFIN